MWDLDNEFNQPYFQSIMEAINNEEDTVYPHRDQFFSAFNLCPYENLNVVILGQDPYHNENQAHGLAFSILPPTKLPPSLKNIYKEIESEFGFTMSKTDGNLSPWAKQGVLLLNTSLSVVAHKPASHSKIGWTTFTKNIIKKISNEKSGIVFLLWGNHAKSFAQFVDVDKHFILSSPHPSPFSARKGFFGNNHFLKTNKILEAQKKPAINWLIP